jgi:hypothetical protein
MAWSNGATAGRDSTTGSRKVRGTRVAPGPAAGANAGRRDEAWHDYHQSDSPNEEADMVHQMSMKLDGINTDPAQATIGGFASTN